MIKPAIMQGSRCRTNRHAHASQVAGLNTSAAAASPPLFTGDSGGVGNLMAHGMASSDNLAGLGQFPAPSPSHVGFPNVSSDQVPLLHTVASMVGGRMLACATAVSPPAWFAGWWGSSASCLSISTCVHVGECLQD